MADSSALPVKELIAQAIVAALARISPDNGFVTTVSEVVRPRRTGEGVACKDNCIRVIQDALSGQHPDAPNGDDLVGDPAAIGWRATFACDCIVRVSETATEPMDRVLNVFEADVRKALMADCQFGGLAVDSELGPTTYPDTGQGFEGLTVWLFVDYRVAENDPTVNRA